MTEPLNLDSEPATMYQRAMFDKSRSFLLGQYLEFVEPRVELSIRAIVTTDFNEAVAAAKTWRDLSLLGEKLTNLIANEIGRGD